jgi:hypothetical protein
VHEYRAGVRQRVEEHFGVRSGHVLVDFYVSKDEEVFRWRVQLDCGCIEERMTKNDDTPPKTGGRCSTHLSTAYREIVLRQDRRVEDREPEPVEPPDWWPGDEEGHTWERYRASKPPSEAVWTALLVCGHSVEQRTSVDFDPDLGGETLADFPERLADIRASLLEGEHQSRDPERHAHLERMLELGWPSPSPEVCCYTCVDNRKIEVFQPIGWLVPRTPEPTEQRRPSRTVIKRRLRAAEAAAERARAELAELDADEHEG